MNNAKIKVRHNIYLFFLIFLSAILFNVWRFFKRILFNWFLPPFVIYWSQFMTSLMIYVALSSFIQFLIHFYQHCLFFTFIHYICNYPIFSSIRLLITLILFILLQFYLLSYIPVLDLVNLFHKFYKN